QGDVGMDELAGNTGAEDSVEFGVELLFVAGQEAAVDFGGRGLRDDVDLISGVQNGRIRRVSQGGAGDARNRAYFAQQEARVVRRKFDAESPGGTFQEGPDGREQAYRPFVAAQPADRLGQFGDRVVAVDHRAVAGRA